MSQFEVVDLVFNSNYPVRREDLLSKVDLHPSSVEAGIKDCIKKGYIKKTQAGYVAADDFDQDDLESIKPKTIDELMNDE